MSTQPFQKLRQNSPLYSGNAAFIEAYYEQYLENPDSVEPQWREYFRSLNGGRQDVAHSGIVARFEQLARQPRLLAPATAGLSPEAAEKQAGVLRLINYYRVRGHQAANLDPLGLQKKPAIPDLDPAFHGLGPEDMQTVFNTGSLQAGPDRLPLASIIEIMRKVYTGSIGAEYMYITDTKQKRWIQKRLEGSWNQPMLNADEKRSVLQQLTAAEGIERYLHTRYVGQKRFSLEGADSLIPAVDEIVRRATHHAVDEVVIGMAHRGRLNVLVNILGKSPKELFDEFEGNYDSKKLESSGDVKYHMGFSTDVEVNGRRTHLVLAFNPSHLEIVNPVVEGSVRARQERRNDVSGELILPVLIHGDAAFAGQGVVMETLQLSQSKGYSTGGTIHVIVNNQVGFTTDNPIEAQPYQESRTSLYCTDIAKMLDAPVFHVNGDDPEAVVFVTRLAADYRDTFHKDVIIDLVTYRRHGHNEADEPAITQPLMYQKIKAHPTTRELYARKLVEEGLVPAGEPERMIEEYRKGLDQGKNIARSTLGLVGNQYTVDWSRYQQGNLDSPVRTAVSAAILQELNQRLLTFPDGFVLHPRVTAIMEARRKMGLGEMPMDWGFAETMAYATLLNEGYGVRLSGQDVGRGTFAHRHAVVHNQNDGSTWTALEHVSPKARFAVNDSLLSEEGVLGFEYGYSTAEPNALVIWEAQFGDFANGAQVVIDQFIAAGQAKWGRLCGLTLFLPHGYEGQGPEHSSARLERYLQLCAENNMQVCVPSTPAQMFHMLRRQMLRSARVPLVVMTPKSLLRHKLSVSGLEDLTAGHFRNVIGESEPLDTPAVRRVVFCSGKVYFDLYQARENRGLKNVAIVRIEQLYPFPADEYAAVIAQYPNAQEIVWCQEEPENQGALYQIKHRLEEPLEPRHQFLYACRRRAASTAVGYHKVHVQQQEQVVEAALTGGLPA
jgi:2-oxoglutarate dehydrogenase E1 component